MKKHSIEWYNQPYNAEKNIVWLIMSFFYVYLRTKNHIPAQNYGNHNPTLA